MARSSFALGLAAAIALIASAAADAQTYGPGYGPYGVGGRYGPGNGMPYGASPGGAYDSAFRGAYDAALGGTYDAALGGPEIFSGTSAPYNASGPGWKDFQLQGR